MKKLFFFLLVLLSANCTIQAQAPQGFNFQGIALDSTGYVVASKLVSLRFSVSTDSLGNLVSYRETVSAQTDKYGQFTAVIGNGMPSIGRFSSIIWSSGSLYMKTEIDIANTGKYVVTGLSKLLSVPFALQATTAGNIASDIYGNTKAGTSALDNPKPQTTTGNVAVGDSALKYSNGLNNTAIGSRSMLKNNSASQNTAVGSASLYSNTTGGSNSALGFSALGSNTTGNNNSAVGLLALGSNTTGNFNTAIGQLSLYFNTIGSDNTANGKQSLGSNTTGSFNTASGFYSLGLNKTGNYNTAIGINAGGKLTTGDKNIFIGNDAANNNNFKTTSNKLVIQNDSSLTPLIYGEFDTQKLTINGDLVVTGSIAYPSNYNNTAFGRGALGKIDTAIYSNTAFGTNALSTNKSGFDNTAVGMEALSLNVVGNASTAIGRGALLRNTASENTAIGKESMGFNSTGTRNTAIGVQSLNENTLGNNNIAIGFSSLLKNTTGNYNTAIGNSAGKLNVGDKNIFIGNDAANNNNFKTTSNKLVIQNDSSLTPLIYGEFDTQKLTINGDLVVTGKMTGAAEISSDAYGNTKAGTSALANPKPQTTTGNVAIGDSALKYSTGLYNTAVGSKSMLKNSSGSGNTAIGQNALSANTTGINNTAIGSGSLSRNTTSNFNTAIGAMSLVYNTSGERNSAIGVNSLYKNTIGSGNTAIGESSMFSNTEGKNNVALGSDVLFWNSTGSFNTALGDSTMFWNTIGSSNIAVGYLALKSNTVGFSNTTTGVKSLFSNTTGSRNTALGDSSMLNNTTGSFNTATGYSSLASNTTGEFNSAYGSYSMEKNTSGTENIAFGGAALRNNTNGSSNVALGAGTLNSNTTGGENTAIGRRAMNNNTTGTFNTAVGQSALYANTTGSNNTAMGRLSLVYNTAESNTAFGSTSLNKNTTGKNNTGIGYYVLGSNLTGSNNTGIGFNAGAKLTSGDKNVFIGNEAGNNFNFSAVSNKLVIDNSDRADPLVMGDFTSRAMVINGDSSISKTATLEIKNGDTYISNSTKGIILTSPNGSCFRVTVGDDGSLVRTPIACPSYDISSNVSSVKMGTKVWTDKNLDVSTYRNGDTIPQVTNSGTWAGLTTGAWCWYNNDSANGATYGKLYNWYAINDPRGLAPKGWHIATGTEWDSLVGYLGSIDAGGKMKSTSNLWNSPNVGATNSSGFSCLPGGFRADYGSFLYVGSVSWFTYNGNNLPVFLSLTSGSATTQPRNAFGYWNNLTEKSGVYVRCVKD
jgi:uncharacterized protein (TIGR02145 family)